MAMVRKFCTASATGWSTARCLSAPIALWSRSEDAFSKLLSDTSSALNALIVLAPSSSSRVSALTESTNHCILRVYGMLRHTTIMHEMRRTMNAPAVTAVHSKLLPAIFRVAHTAMIGALMMLLIPRDTNCMIWLTSFVVRVMRDAAVKESMSCLDQVAILLNSLSRMFMHRDEAAYDARSDVISERTSDTTAHSTIAKPHSAIIGGASPFCRW